MNPFPKSVGRWLAGALLFGGLTLAAAGGVHRIRLAAPPVASEPQYLPIGTPTGPRGTIKADAQSLWYDGRRWAPVFGEFHYSRHPLPTWREELLQMKAGGIDVVSTYVFWIHHEEEQGHWDWSRQRDLRAFIEATREAGLLAIVRIGPWCHGEVRNGGLPDWLLQSGVKARTDDSRYLERVRELYHQIASQLDGLLWKDGGPVIGVQLENEYRGPAEHLLTLKSIAREAGIEVPLYTRTGWPELATPMPPGEMLPLYGGYAEGFWDRELAGMPGTYWTGFRFATQRTDHAIANEQLGTGGAGDGPDVAAYPYLTCEIGGGMMSSYHRRILIDPRDVLATTLVKLGSGGTSPGYYMYHGGVNPRGRRTTLMESQSTPITNWNDMPVRNYDFQAPLGAFGQVRPHYHLLRRLHLYLSDFGRAFARYGTSLPEDRPSGHDDLDTLRWAVRSDGEAGLVFINTYERGRELPAQADVRFGLALASGKTLTWPSEPVTIPSGKSFFWPFGFRVGESTRIDWITAQPVCAVPDASGGRTFFFAALPGVPVELAVAPTVKVEALSGEVLSEEGRSLVRGIQPGRGVAVSLDEHIRLVVLDEADSLALWQGQWKGRECVFLTRAALVIGKNDVRLRATNPDELRVGVYPTLGDGPRDGVFERHELEAFTAVAGEAEVVPVAPAGPLRTIGLGQSPKPVAAAPVDAEFAAAATWRVTLPEGLSLEEDVIVRINYIGDVSRVYIGDKLVLDDFYHGQPLEFGLRAFGSALEASGREFTIAILPLQKDAPIYLSPGVDPEWGDRQSIAALRSVELVPRYTVRVK